MLDMANQVKETVRLSASNFPDAMFLDAICRTLSLPRGAFVSAAQLAALPTLDITECNITRLKGIEYFTGLQELFCSGNRITRLDLRCCPALTLVNCERNRLERLTIGQNAALVTLICSSNYLMRLDVSSCTAMQELLCDNNLLKKLVLPSKNAFSVFSCLGNPVSAQFSAPNTPALSGEPA